MRDSEQGRLLRVTALIADLHTVFFFSSRRRHTSLQGDWSSDVCSSDLNEYAQISYDYTSEKTSDPYKRWMGTLPKEMRLEINGHRLLLCHGSPRRINE